MQKYYQKRERLSGKERLCFGCNAKLSKHNPADICAMCERKEIKQKTETAKESIENIIAGLANKNKSKKSSRN